MQYRIRVKQGHPTGVRRRSGLTFTREEQLLSLARLTKEICEDPWLEGRAVEEEILNPEVVTPPIPPTSPAGEEQVRLKEYADKLHQGFDVIFPAAGESSAAPEGAADQKPASDEAASADTKNGDGREGRKKRTH